MKKSLIAGLVAFALLFTIAGCTKSEEALVSPAISAAATGATTVDPGSAHQGLGGADVPAGVGHKGTVLEALDASGYTYIQVEENGSRFWLATMSVKVKKGDEIEFADAPVFPSFQSKTLDRTFENLMMVAGIRNNGRK